MSLSLAGHEIKSQGQELHLQILTLPPARCVISGKSLNPSDLLFPHFQNSDDNSTYFISTYEN